MVVVALSVYMVYAYVIAGVLWKYCIFGFLLFAIFGIITLCRKKTHYVHVHHYTAGMFLVVLIGYQSIPAGIVHAFANGMMIEGGGRWGYDDIWCRNKVEDPEEEAAEKAKIEAAKKAKKEKKA